jgi:hypothetical protein
MKYLSHVTRLLCTVGILLIGSYTFISLLIAFFIVAGLLTPGSAMFYDSRTPTLANAILFFLIGSAITAIIALARHRLSPPAPTQDSASIGRGA